ncbi:MAG: hypothetical protein IT525_00755 [Nitrosomonas sp.]|nr:hypothetical protein [Nitrosomonas sp.]
MAGNADRTVLAWAFLEFLKTHARLSLPVCVVHVITHPPVTCLNFL